MDYPKDFPEHLKARVDAVIHRAEVVYIDARAIKSPTAHLDFIQLVFFGFARQCVQAGIEQSWSGERIRKAFREFLDTIIERTFQDKDPTQTKDSTSAYLFRGRVLAASRDWPEWREINQSLVEILESTLEHGTINQTPSEQTDEKTRREHLLSEYKQATGTPSNRRIYEARNSGIHKPEFYKWLHGHLSCESATLLNFERFLREKRPPLPRK